MRERRMLVYADWLADEPIPIGELFVSEGRGRELFSFSYSEKWLRGDHVLSRSLPGTYTWAHKTPCHDRQTR